MEQNLPLEAVISDPEEGQNYGWYYFWRFVLE